MLKKFFKILFPKLYCLTLLVILLMLSNCVEKVEKKIANTQSKLPKNQVLQIPPIYLDSLASETEILKHFEKRSQDISKLLENISPEKANDLYKNYQVENDSALRLLTTKNAALLERFYEFGTYDPTTNVFSVKFPKEVEKKVNNYKEHHIEFWDIGEAMTELRIIPDYYAKIFDGKMTPDFLRYLEMITQDEQELFVSDASLSVSWREAAKRVEDREKFLLDFPQSTLIKTVREELVEYQFAYLLGFDNTQTNENGVLNKENILEFQRFTKENPKSFTTVIIKEMLRGKFTGDQLQELVSRKLER